MHISYFDGYAVVYELSHSNRIDNRGKRLQLIGCLWPLTGWVNRCLLSQSALTEASLSSLHRSCQCGPKRENR